MNSCHEEGGNRNRAGIKAADQLEGSAFRSTGGLRDRQLRFQLDSRDMTSSETRHCYGGIHVSIQDKVGVEGIVLVNVWVAVGFTVTVLVPDDENVTVGVAAAVTDAVGESVEGSSVTILQQNEVTMVVRRVKPCRNRMKLDDNEQAQSACS
eukprot:gene3754-biopygen12208